MRFEPSNLPRLLSWRSRQERRQVERVFTEIYRTGAWGSSDSASGPGSTQARAADFLPGLIAAVRDLGTAALLDAPCGDFNWASSLAECVESYVGVDVVAELIARNRKRFVSPKTRFLRKDIMRDRLPSCDTILCRDALVHFSQADVFATLANFRRTGARFLITTTFLGDCGNEDIETGGWRPINLEREPFRLPPPIAYVDELCQHTNGIYADKRLGVWRLQEIPTP
jgi:hypothetical protein